MVLGDVYRAEGRRSEAESLYIRAMEISEKAFGPENGDVVDLRLRLAALYQESGRNAEAELLLVSALGACTKAAARGDATPVQRVRQATALLLLGRSAEARPLAEGVFATGYRRRPFLELCAKNGIAPPVSGST